MKRIVAVALTLVISMFALSCQKIVDDTTSQVTDDLTYSNSPTWDASVWTGSDNAAELEKQVITRTVTASATAGSVESTVTTIIPLTTESISLTLNADKSYTFVETEAYTANAENNYVADNYNYSTLGNTLDAPDQAYPLTKYRYNNTNYAVIAGEMLQTWQIQGRNDLYTIGATASASYGGEAVFPVTFDPATAGKLSGKPLSTTTTTGTWEILDTTDPVNNTQSVRLRPTSSSFVEYDYTGALVTSETTTSAQDPNDYDEMVITKALDAASVDTYYARINWGGTKLYLTK